MADRDADCALKIHNDIPPEILLQIFSYLPFETILRARSVCCSWHRLIPQAINSLYQTLLSKYLSSSIPVHLPEYLQVTLDQRKAFVEHIEHSFNVRLPHLFRTTLLEWPSKYLPPGHEWPESLCWYANKVCIRCLSSNEACTCCHPELVGDYHITLTQRLFSLIINDQPIPPFEDNLFAWELFNSPPRMISEREEQTRRMIRLYADTLKQRTDSSLWVSLYVKCLPLYTYISIKETKTMDFSVWFYLEKLKVKYMHGNLDGMMDGKLIPFSNSVLRFSLFK